jgi:uncharacterized protein
MEEQLLRSSLNPRHLELTLMPTEQCNFRCTYCYEDFSIGHMSPEVQSALKRFIELRVQSLNYLNFQWFGGEPLAARQLVYELSAFAQNLCESRGVRFGGALTTNGYQLSMDVVEKLFVLGQRGYQISLDGWGAGHDMTRRLASGGGTFDRIWSNLLAIRKSSLQVNVLLRMHLTPQNIESVKVLAPIVREELLSDSRFKVLLKPIENLGGPLSGSIASLSKAERAMALAEVNLLLGLKSPIPGQEQPAPPPSICYASDVPPFSVALGLESGG